LLFAAVPAAVLLLLTRCYFPLLSRLCDSDFKRLTPIAENFWLAEQRRVAREATIG